MFSGRRLGELSAVLLFVVASTLCAPAQQQTPTPRSVPTPQQTPADADAQDEIKVRTEEVRIPIFATDEQGRFDPTLEPDDILVLEDDVPQEVRSVRRIPASILLVIGTGGELNPSIRTSTSRAAARYLVSNLREGDSIAALQFTNRVELLHDWTTDKSEIDRTLRTKLIGGRGSRLSQAILEAARMLQSQPVGNRHLVLITDGVETPGRMGYQEALRVLGAAGEETPEAKARAAEAVRQLNAAGATVHVISYTTIGQRDLKAQEKRSSQSVVGMAQSRADMATVGIDPTRPPGMNGSGINAPQVGAGITFDPQMRKLRKAYEKAMQRSEARLLSIAEETGGRIWMPTTNDELISDGREVAREIGSQYVVTYRPKRPLADAPPNQYRRLVVAPRRIGLKLRARRGYVVSAAH